MNLFNKMDLSYVQNLLLTGKLFVCRCFCTSLIVGTAFRISWPWFSRLWASLLAPRGRPWMPLADLLATSERSLVSIQHHHGSILGLLVSIGSHLGSAWSRFSFEFERNLRAKRLVLATLDTHESRRSVPLAWD